MSKDVLSKSILEEYVILKQQQQQKTGSNLRSIPLSQTPLSQTSLSSVSKDDDKSSKRNSSERCLTTDAKSTDTKSTTKSNSAIASLTAKLGFTRLSGNSYYGKQYYFNAAATVPTTTGSAIVPFGGISQGDGIYQRTGDSIRVRHIELTITNTWYPHSTGATSQNWQTADHCADHNVFFIATNLLPVTPGTSGLSVTWSAASPPTVSSGAMFSLGVQGTRAGSNYYANPEWSRLVDIHEFFREFYLSGTKEQQLYPYTAVGSATVAATWPPIVSQRKINIPYNKIVTYNTATANPVVNQLELIYYAVSSAGTRQGLGYNSSVHVTGRVIFDEVDDD